MALKPWDELPVRVKRSRKNLYNYLKSELTSTESSGSGSSSSQEPVVEEPAQEDPVVTTRDISITVDDSTNAVQGASVVIGETTKTTGSAGGCTFPGIEDGDVSVSVSAEGYTSKTETITVSSESTSFTISLTAVVADPDPDPDPNENTELGGEG